LKGDILHISITTVCEDACVCVCVWKMEGVVHDTLIEHGVERHLPYAVYRKWRGAVCDRAWCGASPAICCVCVCGKWREWCMILSLSMVWSVTCHMLCMQDGGMQCVIEHGVERHLPYVVCVCVENGGSGA